MTMTESGGAGVSVKALRSVHTGPEGVKAQYDARAVLRPDEVRIRVAAAGVNFRDVALQAGNYLPNMLRPYIPLSEGAGVVIETGAEVDDLKDGDAVLGHYVVDWQSGPFRPAFHDSKVGGPSDGWLAEEVVMPRRALLRVPVGWRLEEAAALAISGVTAWRALRGLVGLEGQHVLLPGTGNVSLQALELAASAGARALVVTSRPELSPQLMAMGAAAVIHRHQDSDDLVESILSASDGQGVDVALDTVGGQFLVDIILPSMATNGRVALLGFLEGSNIRGDVIGPAIRKLLQFEGISVGSRLDFERLLDHMQRHHLRPRIARRTPPNRWSEVFREPEWRDGAGPQEALGKHVVIVDQGLASWTVC